MNEKFPDISPYKGFLNNPLIYIDDDDDGNIESPIKGYGLYQSNQSSKVTKNHFFKSNVSLGHKGHNYSYAYKKSGHTNALTDQQKLYRKQGMLITVNSEFFALRNVGTRPHVGVDLKASICTNVYSFGDGEIMQISYSKGIGNFMIIKYSNGDKVRFMHLSKYATGMKHGAKVYEGQIIANSGNTGVAGGGNPYPPNLHVDAVSDKGEMVDSLGRNYGRVSNKVFFEKYGGIVKNGFVSKWPTKFHGNTNATVKMRGVFGSALNKFGTGLTVLQIVVDGTSLVNKMSNGTATADDGIEFTAKTTVRLVCLAMGPAGWIVGGIIEYTVFGDPGVTTGTFVPVDNMKIERIDNLRLGGESSGF